jgi:UDP-GlcNAc:undecaprenyl-phosphate/decaprenyl-phosphate GlcNAc-1-phosphate transferase
MTETTKLFLLCGFTCLLAWGLGLYLTPLAMAAARSLNCVAKPDGVLRTQREPVPYLGGVAIYLALLFALTIAVDFTPVILGLLLGATIILLVGMVDDFGVMTAKMKLFGQIIAAVALVKAGIVIELTVITHYNWPYGLPLLAWGLSLLWLIGMANAMNFLDIEDGLAGSTAAGILPGLFVVALINGRIDNAIVAAGLFGAVLAFLHYNAPAPTARIYLGDAGSLLLGMVLASLAMLGSYTAQNDAAALGPVIIMGVPCFELFVTMTARARKGLPVWRGSPDHIAKRLQRAGLSRAMTVIAHAGASLALGGIAVFVMKTDLRHALIAVAALLAVALVAAVLLLRVKTT